MLERDSGLCNIITLTLQLGLQIIVDILKVDKYIIDYRMISNSLSGQRRLEPQFDVLQLDILLTLYLLRTTIVYILLADQITVIGYELSA